MNCGDIDVAVCCMLFSNFGTQVPFDCTVGGDEGGACLPFMWGVSELKSRGNPKCVPSSYHLHHS
jgi:hypothetical protein